MDTCHRCGVLIKNADIPVTGYFVVGPAIKNVTPDEAVEAFGAQLSPYVVANLSKRMARSVYCGGCISAITANVPADEVQRINEYAATEQ